jgi:hypothetical protein
MRIRFGSLGGHAGNLPAAEVGVLAERYNILQRDYPMTFPELLEIGKSCLAQYEQRLSVVGQEPYNEQKAVAISVRYEGSLSAASKNDMEQVIGTALERFADLKGGIVMSEPRPLRNLHNADEAAVSLNALNLSFIHGWDNAPPYTEITWVQCWHYPIP